jgi:RNA polymerase sigma factor (sigma-70 family)
MPLLPPNAETRFGRSGEIREAVFTGREDVWEVSDEALLAGYATGDPDAATVFVRRFQTRMIGLALVITRDRVDAEEVAQDAFVRAWRYAASYDARRGSVKSWLLGIVRNVALDRVRLASNRHEQLFRELPSTFWTDVHPDTADTIGERDAVARIVASLQVLPVEQRETLLAVTLYGLSGREASEALNVPLGTVKTRIRLGLRKVRDHLGSRIP